MNILETIYCSQYYEMRKTGRDPMKGRLNGSLVSAVVLMLYFTTFMILLAHFMPGNSIEHWFRDVTRVLGRGRAAGKLFAVIAIFILFGILWLTYGNKANYERMMARWEQLPEDVLKKTLLRSLIFFGISIVAFIVTLIVTL